MRAKASDTQIRAGLRSVLTRHRVDLNKTSFFCAGGVVRMLGEMQRFGTNADANLDLGEMEVIEHEIQNVKGVLRVHFDLANMRKLSNGQWDMIEKHVASRAKNKEKQTAALGDTTAQW